MISPCGLQVAGRVDVIAAVMEWGLDIVDHCYMNMFQSYSSFSHKVSFWKWWRATTRYARLDEASFMLNTGVFPKMSSHTKLKLLYLLLNRWSLSFFLCLLKWHGDTRYKADENLIAVWWLTKSLVWPLHSLPYSQYTVWIEFAGGLKFCRLVSFPNIPFRSLSHLIETLNI